MSDPFDDSSGSSTGSSPPLPDNEDTTGALSIMDKKRLHDETNEDVEEEAKSSATMIGDVASSAPPAVDQVTVDAVKLSTAAHKVNNMAPPPLPTTSMFPSTQKPPTSGRSQPKPKSMQSPTGRPEPEHRNDSTASEKTDIASSDDDSDVSGEPQEAFSEFDWKDLEERYHRKIGVLLQRENQAMAEFNDLCSYFSIWANAGSVREVDRSYKRLKTQETYVQHEEDELEEKRLHYTKVVDAFRCALDLLA